MPDSIEQTVLEVEAIRARVARERREIAAMRAEVDDLKRLVEAALPRAPEPRPLLTLAKGGRDAQL